MELLRNWKVQLGVITNQDIEEVEEDE